MNILAFALTYWNTPKDVEKRASPDWHGLRAWRDRVQYLFKPMEMFWACGSWSDPRFNPTPDVRVVNAGLPFDAPYEGFKRHYGKAAFTAAFAFACNRNDWDLLLTLDTDALVGAVDFPKLFAEFLSRKESLLAPGWGGYPGGPFMVFKREAALRLLHYRQCANLRDKDEPDQEIWEAECAHIFREGRWWNPWPEIGAMFWTEAFYDEANKWPFVRGLIASEVDIYIKEQFSKAIPL